MQANRLSNGITDHVLEEVTDIEISLVADRDELTEPDPLIVRSVVDGQHERAALRDEADMPRYDLLHIQHARRCQRHAVSKVDQTKAVRADEPHARLRRNPSN